MVIGGIAGLAIGFGEQVTGPVVNYGGRGLGTAAIAADDLGCVPGTVVAEAGHIAVGIRDGLDQTVGLAAALIVSVTGDKAQGVLDTQHIAGGRVQRRGGAIAVA